jgi:prepilin-type N-terminal cleavage/methylation domain-containing protein/prepilin-type processing-associated H-X9-DG protein
MRNTRASILAFTLVELLVTMSIIAVLAALLLPALGRGKESGRVALCQGNLHQIGLALQLYVDDNKNIMPSMTDYNALVAPTNQTNINIALAPQLGSTNVLCCPSDNQQIFQKTGSSYSWNNLVNGQNADQLQIMNLSLAMTKIPLVFDKQGFHALLGANHAVNYLYADGHIKNLLIISGTQ